jgi:GntR family transcriptional regulator of arabinose operon
MEDIHSHSLYRVIAQKVEEIIQERKLKPHEPVPSEGELAKRFGVSRMTAKLALEQLVDKGMVYRLPRRGTFLSDPAHVKQHQPEMERGFVSSVQTTKLKIAFVVSNLDYYTSKIVSEIDNEARKHSFILVIKLSKDVEDEDHCLKQLAADGVDGIILFPRGRTKSSELLNQFKQDKYPIVLIDRTFHDIQLDSVFHDHFQGAYEMMQFLIRKGHHEIGYVTNRMEGISSREERYQGYMKALFDHDIPVKSQYIHFTEKTNNLTNYSEENNGLDQFLSANPNMTAVMCSDDYVAASAIYSALRLNIAVPAQLSFTGFSDNHLATMLPISLTTVKQPAAELVQEAVKLLLARIRSYSEGQSIVKIKTQIIERRTVS